MSSDTKIIVLKQKELVITGIFAFLAIIFFVLLIMYFTNKAKTGENVQVGTFNPGVYTASVILSGNAMDVEVTVDSNDIKSIRLINTATEITTMYPLITTSLSDIEKQVKKTGSTRGITYSSDTKYTSLVLLSAIETALSKARIL